MPVIEFTGSAIGGGSPDTPARRSIRNIRRRLARRLGSLTLAKTTAAGADTKKTFTAVALSGGLDTNRFRQQWVWPCNGVNEALGRRVAESGLNIATGEVTVTVAWPTIMPIDVWVEMHRLLPPVDHDGKTGLLTHINHALAELWQTQRLALATAATVPNYELPAEYADWLEPEAVRELWYTPSGLASTVNPATWPGFAAYRNAEDIVLEGIPSFGAGMSIQVDRPLDTFLKRNGTWQAVSDGALYDTDEVLANPELVVEVALLYAYESLADISEGKQQDRYDRLMREQRVKANVAKQALPQLPLRQSGGLGYIGPKSDPLRLTQGGW